MIRISSIAKNVECIVEKRILRNFQQYFKQKICETKDYKLAFSSGLVYYTADKLCKLQCERTIFLNTIYLIYSLIQGR